MAIDMNFEIDEQLTAIRALELLQRNGFVEFEHRTNGVNLSHAESGLVAYFSVNSKPQAVFAEGIVAPKWKCKYHMTFNYSKVKFEASKLETMRFARTLASEASAYFVLSFQHENVYAIRDEKGYREVSDTTATMENPVQ